MANLRANLKIPSYTDNEPLADDNKSAWEKQATLVFIEWYASTYKKSFTYITHNQPAKPDVSCQLDGKPLDIEIAHLYGTEQEAMSILGKSLNQHTKNELTKLRENTTTEERLANALNRILENKSHKSYSSDRTWLVIRNVHPGWQAAQFTSMQESVLIPDHHPFQQIWLVGDIKAASGAICLFGDRQASSG